MDPYTPFGVAGLALGSFLVFALAYRWASRARARKGSAASAPDTSAGLAMAERDLSGLIRIAGRGPMWAPELARLADAAPASAEPSVTGGVSPSACERKYARELVLSLIKPGATRTPVP